MPAFSPTAAALEGFRVIRREPKAVLVWAALWVVVLSMISLIKAVTGNVASLNAPSHRSSMEILESFGPLAAVLVPALLALSVVTTAAVYRAVLRPHEKSWFFMRLGMDEVRLGVMTAIASVLVLVLGGVPASVLLFLLNPILAAVPTFARYIAIGGAVVTVALEIWIAVRLSLIAVETFAEKRFHLTAYWPLARGYFWRLLWAYILVGLEFLAFLLISFLAVLLFGVVQGWIGDPQGADILRRGLLLGMAGVLAAFAAILLVIPSILVSACQAYAFRAFADDSPTVYGMSWADVPSED